MSSTSHNTHSVDDLIRAQLGPLQATIFTSFQGGDEALSSFKESWSSFKKTYDACSSILLEETRTTVESFAYLLHTISSALLASELIHEQYERDIAHLADVKFKKLSLNDQSDPISTPQAPYIKSCYVWLLNNLHNPYPSKALRARIADETNYDARDIDAWFVDARRRIGWNRVRRAHFETRADMVKAATRHFKPKARAIRSGPYNPPFQPDDVSTMDYSSHFVAMEADAQALYSHKFIPATLATSIDPTKRPCAGKQDTTSSYPSPRRTPSRDVERTSGVDDNSDKPQKRRNSEIDFDLASADGALRPLRPLKRSRIASPSFVHSNPSSSLPSPSPSFHRGVSFSPSPSVATSPLEEDVNSAFVTGKRKRRTSDANEYDSESSDIIRVRRKRRGGDIDVESDISTSNSLSQQKRSLMSVSSSLQPLLHTTPSPVSNQSLEQSTSRKRKRRLSNAEGDQAPKHPTHAALMVPRLQTVSNPLPIYSFSSSVQDVPTNLLTEVSCLAETATFDLSKNVEIEVFDYASQPILSDYLSQVNPASSYPDKLDFSPAASTDFQSLSPVYGSTNATSTFPLLDLDFGTVTQLSPLSNNDDFFSNIQLAAPDIWQDYSSSMDKQISMPLDQTFDPNVANPTNTLPTQSLGVNPFDLLLYSNGDIPSVDDAKPMMALNPSNAESRPLFGNVSQVDFAIHKIHALQAELEMCKNQLAQRGMFSI